ncbi:MAG: WecB/TagA/CpsF family glycosyltransferase [Oscillospiraceae bacterium]|nr:WecB/TagA/CpsF family glycosyltransferase [Oscillospiraceae bacterium]
MKIDVMGVQFDNVTMEEAVAQARGILDGGAAHYCVTPNPEIVYEAMHDSSFCRLLNGAALVLPDGVGVLLGAKILGTPLRARVSGVDFAAALLPVLAAAGKRLYLLGAKPGVAELAAEKMRAANPGLCICGTADGYFQDEGPVVQAVREAEADVVFVCLGSPKQEKFMAAHLDELGASLLMGLGGSLDAFAGTVKRAPAWVSRIGMEWFYRLVKEPRRFKRMLRLPKFVFAVVGRRLGGGRHG